MSSQARPRGQREEIDRGTLMEAFRFMPEEYRKPATDWVLALVHPDPLTDNGPERYRVHGDPDLTEDARVYEVLSPDPLNPDWPVRYRIDVTGGAPAVLSCEQPGPFLDPASSTDMFIDLETLERLGRVAAALRAQAQGT